MTDDSFHVSAVKTRPVARGASVGLWRIPLLLGVLALGSSCRPSPASPPTTPPTTLPPAEAASLDPMREIADGLWLIDLPASAGKSTVVELSSFVVLLEVPLRDEGGGATELVDDVEGSERILRTLRSRFPTKPLRYVLSSHWHPHSLSGLRPFLDAGATLVTTRANLARLEPLLGSGVGAEATEQVQLVEGSGTTLADDEGHRIVVHRFEQRDYPSTPTEDYLLFELPDHQAVHAGCMYNNWEGGPVAGRELVTSRELDLHRLLADRGLSPTYLLRIQQEPEGSDERLPFARLDRVVRHGIKAQEVAAPYRALTAEELRRERARLLAEALANNVPGPIFNGLAYQRLAAHDLDGALELAMLQALVSPTDANAWDTLGEVYYAMGRVEAARAYERTAKAIDPEHSGGEAAWKADLEQLRAQWPASP